MSFFLLRRGKNQLTFSPPDGSISKHAPALPALGSCRRCGSLSAQGRDAGYSIILKGDCPYDHEGKEDPGHRRERHPRERHRFSRGPDRHSQRAYPRADRAPEAAPQRRPQPSWHVQDGR